MSVTSPSCPRCGVPVQPDWDWCHACSFHPDDLAHDDHTADAARPTAPPTPIPPPLASSTRAIPSAAPQGRGRWVGAVVGAVVVLVVAAVAVAAIVVVVNRGSSTSASEPTATPAFADGLAVWFTSADPGSHAALLPDGLAGCVQQKLTVGDVTAVAALQQPADHDRIGNETEIHVYRSLKACDLSGSAEVLTGQGNVFSDFGVHAIAQQQCVMEHFITGVAALSDHVTATMKPRVDAKLVASFQACVPISVGLAGVLASTTHGPTPDQARCIGSEMATTIHWTDLFKVDTPAGKQKLNAALLAAMPHCQ